MDRGVPHTHLDSSLTPGLLQALHDVKAFDVPHTIVDAGENHLQGVATGNIYGTIIDDAGNEETVPTSAIVVPCVATNLSSVTSAMVKGAATLIHPSNPRLEIRSIVSQMQQMGIEEKTG